MGLSLECWWSEEVAWSFINNIEIYGKLKLFSVTATPEPICAYDFLTILIE